MNKRLKLLGIFITASLCCYAQTKEFDPSLDPNVTIVSRQSQEEWNSRSQGFHTFYLPFLHPPFVIYLGILQVSARTAYSRRSRTRRAIPYFAPSMGRLRRVAR